MISSGYNSMKPASRRQVLRVSAVVAAGAAFRGVPAEAKAPDLRFVSVGDWGRNGHDDQRAVSRAMASTCARVRPSHILSTGDNFYENGVSSVHDPQWKTSFETIYDAASLQVPWRVILGNHDYRGDVQAQIDYQDRGLRWQLPARTYRRGETLPDGTSCDFFYIDTNPFLSRYKGTEVRIDGQDTAAQLRWLDGALASSTAAWKIVVGHHPIYTAHGGRLDEPELIAAIDPLLRQHGVRIYINGHVHNFQHVRVRGIDYITNGAGSRIEGASGGQAGGVVLLRHGFMSASLDRNVFAFAFLGTDNQTLYRATLPRLAEL